jgi:hypothetical protein
MFRQTLREGSWSLNAYSGLLEKLFLTVTLY